MGPVNAFTSAFEELEPIPQYKATAKLAGFLQAFRPSQTSAKLPQCGPYAAHPVRADWMLKRRGGTSVKNSAHKCLHMALSSECC